MEVLLIMKKVLAVVLTVCVIFGTSAAFAQPRNFEGRENFNRQQMYRPEMRRDFRPCNFEGNERMRGFEGRHHSMFTPDMPKEIRGKVSELAKLRIDLEEVFSYRRVDKEKALELHKKIQKLENEIDDWKFERQIKRIQAFKKQMELERKKEKPVPPAPKPESEPKQEKVNE